MPPSREPASRWSEGEPYAPSRSSSSASRSAGTSGSGERRTVTIRGQVTPPSAPYRSTAARRRPRPRAHERIAGRRPDRAAMWAVLMGIFLILVAVMTAH